MPGHTLPIGTRLREYEIKGLIGEGPCSIVYLAWDHALQRKVAVKEYMPASLVGRVQGSTSLVVAAERHVDIVRAGLKSFVNEARLLARFDHPSLVKVYRFWEENGTAYMVMPYYEGPTLKAALAELGHVPSEDELRAWLKPILNAVAMLHEGGTWHQNIGPDEIVLTPFGPVLLGFARGVARDRGDPPHAGGGVEARLRRDRAVRQRGGHDARPLDRPVRARGRDLRRDHRQRSAARRRPARRTTRCVRSRSSPQASTARASSTAIDAALAGAAEANGRPTTSSSAP